MTSLSQARSFAEAIDTATNQFEAYIRPTLGQYIDFLCKHVPGRAPTKYKSASEYSFKEVDASLFVFESEEFNYYGEYVSDTVEVPFGFVSSPEAYIAETLKAIRDAEATKTERTRQAAQDRVDNLKRQLEVAERSLSKAK